MYKLSMYKGCMVMVIVLLLLCAFCLTELEPGDASYYLCIFSLIVDIPFFIFLLIHVVRETAAIKREEAKKTEKTSERAEKA